MLDATRIRLLLIPFAPIFDTIKTQSLERQAHRGRSVPHPGRGRRLARLAIARDGVIRIAVKELHFRYDRAERLVTIGPRQRPDAARLQLPQVDPDPDAVAFGKESGVVGYVVGASVFEACDAVRRDAVGATEFLAQARFGHGFEVL